MECHQLACTVVTWMPALLAYLQAFSDNSIIATEQILYPLHLPPILEPHNCQGLCLIKGTTKASVSSSCISLGHAAWSGFRTMIKSAALYRCFLQIGYISLEIINRCRESYHLCLALCITSTAATLTQGSGVQTK